MTFAIHQGEQGVVLAHADVDAGVDWVPRWRTMMPPAGILAAVDLHAEPLGLDRGRCACAAALFMCHLPPGLVAQAVDRSDLEFRVVLAMASCFL